jgi:hypothetical protein
MFFHLLSEITILSLAKKRSFRQSQYCPIVSYSAADEKQVRLPKKRFRQAVL